jgi:hypothetical protein
LPVSDLLPKFCLPYTGYMRPYIYTLEEWGDSNDELENIWEEVLVEVGVPRKT